MRTKAVGALSCSAAGLLCCDAFVVSPPQQHVLASQQQQQQQQQIAGLPATTASSASSPPRPLLVQGPRESVGVRRARPVRNVSLLSMSSFDAAGDAAAARAVPVGPGAGVIDLNFENLKTGGFKVFLLLFLLGVSVYLTAVVPT